MKKFALLCVLFSPLLFGFTDIDNEALKQMSGNGALVVDIRSQDEWIASGVIKNAALIEFFDRYGNVNKADFLGKLKAAGAGKDRQIILICRSGNRSRTAASELEREGFKKVYNHKNGMIGWFSERNSVIRPQLLQR